VRDWRKAEVHLTAMKKTKEANRRLNARWPELEERVHSWVLEHCTAGINGAVTSPRPGGCQGDEYKWLCRRGFLVLPLNAAASLLEHISQ